MEHPPADDRPDPQTRADSATDDEPTYGWQRYAGQGGYWAPTRTSPAWFNDMTRY